jgi:hypothetical protein
MAFFELYPILVAAVLWGQFWSTKRIVCYCDNQSTVHIINKDRSKVTDIMKLMRKLTWLDAKHNFTIYSEHIPAVTNVISNALFHFNFQIFLAAVPTAEVKGTPCPHYW